MNNDLIPLRDADVIMLKHGLHVCRATLIKWCEEFQIGVKIDNKWYIYMSGLNNLIEGKLSKPFKIRKDIKVKEDK